MGLPQRIGTHRWSRYLLAALGTQSLSRADLAARTGLSDTTVRRWLSIMRTEGTIELIGNSPHALYRRSRQQSLFPETEA